MELNGSSSASQYKHLANPFHSSLLRSAFHFQPSQTRHTFSIEPWRVTIIVAINMQFWPNILCARRQLESFFRAFGGGSHELTIDVLAGFHSTWPSTAFFWPEKNSLHYNLSVFPWVTGTCWWSMRWMSHHSDVFQSGIILLIVRMWQMAVT